MGNYGHWQRVVAPVRINVTEVDVQLDFVSNGSIIEEAEILDPTSHPVLHCVRRCERDDSLPGEPNGLSSRSHCGRHYRGE